MTDYTVSEIKEAVAAKEEEEYFDWNELNYGIETLNLRGTEVTVKALETEGGMDEGSRASVTFSVGNQIFRKNGYYASHYGYDWDGELVEVRKVKKMVEVYEEVR